MNFINAIHSVIGELRSLCKEYHQRICIIEDKKYDLEREVETKDWNVSLATDMYTHSLKWETFILNMTHVSFSNRLFYCRLTTWILKYTILRENCK